MSRIDVATLLQRAASAGLASPTLLDTDTRAGKDTAEVLRRHSPRAQRSLALGSSLSVWFGAALLATFLIEMNIVEVPAFAVGLGLAGLGLAAVLAREAPTVLVSQLAWACTIGGQILILAALGTWLEPDSATMAALALALELATLVAIRNLGIGCAAVAAGTGALMLLVHALDGERTAVGPLSLAFGAATAALWLGEAPLAGGLLRRLWQPLAYSLPLMLFAPVTLLTLQASEQSIWPYTLGFAALAGAVFVRAGAELPALAGATRYAVLAGLALISALAPDAPGLSAGLLVLMLSHLRRMPGLQAIALAAIGGYLFLWYHDLQTSLLNKSLAAIGNGVVLLIGAAALRRATGQARETDVHTTKRRLADRLGLAAALLLALAIPAWQVAAKEQVLARGQPMLLRLAPVDPRSLIQGDYMILSYAIAEAARDAPGLSRSGALIVRLDLDGVATLVRIDDGRPLAQGERRLRYRLRDHQRLGAGVRLGAESYFFPEGTGQRYESAMFGELIADERGESVLVALRDGERRRLGTPLH